MRILRLHVENFGTLKDLSLDLDGGMNVLYHQNGWGKSTLAVFIKAMLYGLPASSKRSLDENERKKYAPWQGGAYGGSLEFESAKGTFRVERFFGAKESGDSFALFDLSSNKPSAVYTASLGEELFGIDAEGFERSTYLSQRALSGGKDNNSISAKLGNLLDDVGDIGNYDAALAALDKRRRYYVMTGNRGAIAELEESRMSLVAELERLRRLEEPLQAQEQELEACTEQMKATRKAIAETRRRIERAGLARERAVLLEQKNKMLSELSELHAQKARIEGILGDPLPTASELSELRSCLEEMREVHTRLQAVSQRTANTEALPSLREKYKRGLPNPADLARVSKDNEQMCELRVRYETLSESMGNERESARFAKGVPTSDALEQARELLTRASSIRTTLSSEVKKSPSHSLQLPIALALSCLGIFVSILSFLPTFASVSAVLLAVGVVMLVGGLVWVGVSIPASRRRKRNAEETELKRARMMREAQNAEQRVALLLRNYGMPDDDLLRSLTELSMMCEQYRANRQRLQRAYEELEQLKKRREMISERICAYLSKFLGQCDAKEDYQDDIDRLRRESEALLRMEQEERRRLSAKTREQERLLELQSTWNPYFERYGSPDMTDAECLDYVSSQLRERERLVRESTQKENALKAFLSDKRLETTDAEDANELLNPAQLAEDERYLQTRLADLQRRQITLRGGVERLSEEVDRIPELEGEIAQIKLRIDEARANSATVAHTAAFLEEAKTALSTRYLDGMQDSFRRYLSILCEAEAPEAVMDTSFEVRLREGGQTRSMESFSRGWRDAVELCVRLSLTDALYAEGEVPFLLLDDPLVNLDDKRLNAARRLMERVSEKYQIVYMVCHRDRI